MLLFGSNGVSSPLKKMEMLLHDLTTKDNKLQQTGSTEMKGNRKRFLTTKDNKLQQKAVANL